MNERLAIVSDDAKYGAWLQHYIGTFRPYADIVTSAPESFLAAQNADSRPWDIVVLHACFAEEPTSTEHLGLDWLRRLRAKPLPPAIVAIAEMGDELAAVEAIRQGAADYLPRLRVTPERLSAALRRAAHQRDRRNARVHGSSFDSLAQTEPVELVIPRYEILRTLGRSDRANVYLATAADREEPVALKVTQLLDADDNDLQEQLSREYRAIAAIDHPCVVDIYDYGVHAGREYLAMEYFARGDLKQRLADPVPVASALAYAERIASALEVVHNVGLVHRDLKPQNVMLRENDDIVLIDFGLAKLSTSTTGSTRTGLLRGSPYFMSPEQAQGLPVDGRSDIYSLGVMLYEMLLRRKPFHGTTAIEVLQQHVSAPVPQLPDALACFQPLLDRMLAKKADDRFASAAVLRTALASV